MSNRFAALAEDDEVRDEPAPKVEAPAPAKPAAREPATNPNRRNQRPGAPRRGRQFDRHSGTGRGRENSKNGAGAHNWGNRKDPKEELKNETDPIEPTPVDPATPQAAESTEAPAETTEEPKEPEATFLTLDEYKEQQKKSLEDNELFKPLEVRKVEEIKGERIVKGEEDDYFVGGTKKEKKERAQKDKNFANDAIKFSFGGQPRHDHRNNRRNNNRRVNINSDRDFPALA